MASLHPYQLCILKRLLRCSGNRALLDGHNLVRYSHSETNKSAVEEVSSSRAKELLIKEFPDEFKDGKYASRIAYVDFIDDALARMKDLGIERDIEAYKELLRIFPPGKYHPTSAYTTFSLSSAPQELAAVRVLNQMEKNKLKPDKDIERLIISAFSKASVPWLKTARWIYWSRKGRHLNPDPFPEKLPKEPHKLAKLGLMRMLKDQKTVITTTNTSNVPTSCDKTWIVYAQSPAQKSLIDKIPPNTTLYLEESGLSYVDEHYLSYFTLRYYEDEATYKRKSEPPRPDYNFNTLKMQFYGKPIREKCLDQEEAHYVDGTYVLAIGFTGTSSQDSLLSWLKILQQRNPNLSRLNVLFRMSRPTPELVEVNNQEQQQRQNN